MDRGDASAREHLRRLLERGGRWDELAAILEQEASSAQATEDKIATEKKLAQLHEVKRKDLASAGEAWARIAELLSGDEAPIQTAIKLFEKAQRSDLACQVIEQNAASIEDRDDRAALYVRLAELHEKSGRLAEAGEGYVLAAETDGSLRSWGSAERSFSAAENGIVQRSRRSSEPSSRPTRRSAPRFWPGRRVCSAKPATRRKLFSYVDEASKLQPDNDGYAAEVEKRLRRSGAFRGIGRVLRRSRCAGDRQEKTRAAVQARRRDSVDAPRRP